MRRWLKRRMGALVHMWQQRRPRALLWHLQRTGVHVRTWRHWRTGVLMHRWQQQKLSLQESQLYSVLQNRYSHVPQRGRLQGRVL